MACNYKYENIIRLFNELSKCIRKRYLPFGLNEFEKQMYLLIKVSMEDTFAHHGSDIDGLPPLFKEQNPYASQEDKYIAKVKYDLQNGKLKEYFDMLYLYEITDKSTVDKRALYLAGLIFSNSDIIEYEYEIHDFSTNSL